MLALMPFPSVSINAERVNLSIIDPTENQEGPHKGPVHVPELSIEDYTLTFTTPCYGYTLELIDEDGDVAYTTLITSNTLVLPSTLSGDYELRLYPDGSSIYFYGYVTF